ncbi:MAG: aminopeptidase [Proteobacteria bacterium]|nr:aminopeptidase [Pseudomonadota bacterium]
MGKMSMAGRETLLAHHVMKHYVGLKEGEQVLILADSETDDSLVEAFASAAYFFNAEPTIVVTPPSFRELEKLPSKVALKALEAADVYIPMTPTSGHSVHATEVARLKSEKKLRMFIIGGWHGGGMDDALDALRNHDYEKIYEVTSKVAEVMNKGKRVHVTTPAGTDFTASIEDIPCRVAAGICRQMGESGCIPAGEAWSGPAEGTTNGVIILDSTIMNICERPEGPKTPVRVTVKDGRVVKVEGGEEAAKLRAIIENVKNADNMAEISVGTNHHLKHTGRVLNDKRRYGTMHVAFGQNTYQIYPKGTVECDVHIDAVLQNPVLEVDGRKIVEGERILL